MCVVFEIERIISEDVRGREIASFLGHRPVFVITCSIYPKMELRGVSIQKPDDMWKSLRVRLGGSYSFLSMSISVFWPSFCATSGGTWACRK